jgi:hypothetical protein
MADQPITPKDSFAPTTGPEETTPPAARAADVGPALRDQASKLAGQSMATGADTAQVVGKAAESAAKALDEALPMLAGYVRNAAQYTNQFADSLREKKAEELLSTAVTWSRQQPLLTLAGATVLGFALARVAKSGLVSNSQAATGQAASKPSEGGSNEG